MSDWQTLVSQVPIDETSVTQALSSIQARGLSHYVENSWSKFNWVASQIQSSQTAEHPAIGLRTTPESIYKSAVFYPRRSAVLRPVSWNSLKPLSPPNSEGGNPGNRATYCKTSEALNLAAGTAFLVIGAMTMGTAPVLAGAAWAGIALWGGYATGGWALVNAMECGF